jgi:hypothetical protein
MTYSSTQKLRENAIRHQKLLDIAQTLGKTFTCKDLTLMTGIESRYVTASLQYLLRGKIIKIVGRYTDNSGHKAIYSLTGVEFDREEVGKMYSKEDAKHHEPNGRLDEKEVSPGHKIVRFGTDWKPGTGQSWGPEKRGFSSLEV